MIRTSQLLSLSIREFNNNGEDQKKGEEPKVAKNEGEKKKIDVTIQKDNDLTRIQQKPGTTDVFGTLIMTS